MNPMLLLYPLINLLITGIFAGVVLRQYAQRHRVYQLYWSIGLVMAFLATLAYVLMTVTQPTSTAGILLFRVYYILGATLTSAWLGLGSIALVTSARVARISFIVLCVLSVLAAIMIALAGVNLTNLSHIAGTPGIAILQPENGLWVFAIATLNTLGVVAVVGVAIYSGWKLIRRQSSLGGLSTSNILWANVLILVGDLLNGIAGGGARLFNLEGSFWLLMSLGWVLFLLGVLLASHRRATAKAPVPQETKQQEAASS